MRNEELTIKSEERILNIFPPSLRRGGTSAASDGVVKKNTPHHSHHVITFITFMTTMNELHDPKKNLQYSKIVYTFVI